MGSHVTDNQRTRQHDGLQQMQLKWWMGKKRSKTRRKTDESEVAFNIGTDPCVRHVTDHRQDIVGNVGFRQLRVPGA